MPDNPGPLFPSPTPSEDPSIANAYSTRTAQLASTSHSDRTRRVLTYASMGIIVAAILVGAALSGVGRDQPEPAVAVPDSVPSVLRNVDASPPNSDDTVPTLAAPAAPEPTSQIRIPGPMGPPISDGDLGLRQPLSVPTCDGVGIVVIHSAVSPGNYSQEIAAALSSNPGTEYLRTDRSCPSLRQKSNDGNPIYAVYRPSGYTAEELCGDVRLQGGDAYGKWLDTVSDPALIVPC